VGVLVGVTPVVGETDTVTVVVGVAVAETVAVCVGVLLTVLDFVLVCVGVTPGNGSELIFTRNLLDPCILLLACGFGLNKPAGRAGLLPALPPPGPMNED